MGNFLKYVNTLDDCKPRSPLVNLSISRIKEYHGSFKSVCDNFAMNLTEFEQIFGMDDKDFAQFDTDNNGKPREITFASKKDWSNRWNCLRALSYLQTAGLKTKSDVSLSLAEIVTIDFFDLFDFNEI